MSEFTRIPITTLGKVHPEIISGKVIIITDAGWLQYSISKYCSLNDKTVIDDPCKYSLLGYYNCIVDAKQNEYIQNRLNIYYKADKKIEVKEEKEPIVYQQYDRIHLHSMQGTYIIDSISYSIGEVRITCNKWFQEYVRGERRSSCKTRRIEDIKCLAGFPNNIHRR